MVSPDKLAMGNAVVPTLASTILGFACGVVGLGVHFISGGGLTGSACVLWFGGACYLSPAGAARHQDGEYLLGPLELEKASAKSAGLAPTQPACSAAGWPGCEHLNQRRQAAYVLGAVGEPRAL